jgi:formylglycine-generating enzyme required for sulfatase activity
MDTLDRPTASGDCPTVATLQAFCQGKLAVIESESISDHVQRCERCASILLDWSNGNAGATPIPEVMPETRVLDSSEGAGVPSGTKKGSTDEPTTSSYRADEDFPEYVGRYRIVRVIGRGGFGKVFLARDEQLERLVAVKVPHPERLQTPSDVAAFKSEATLHAKVDHPHIVPIYDVGGSPKVPFFAVSKFVPGMDLAEVLRRGKPDHQTAVRWVACLADALEHLHSQRLVHRDVKPRNVMIDALGRPLLMDFGLAKKQVENRGCVPVAGTPGYMSPEQARGDQAALDGRSDIYSLGVLFYELLTGSRPFRGGATSIFNQIQTMDPPSPRDADPSIPRDLAAICLKAMAKDPGQRYQRAADFAEDLRHWQAHEPLRYARRVGPVERARLWIRRRPVVAASGGVFLASVTLAAFALFRAPPAGPTIKVAVNTEPPGADVHFFPIDPKSGLLQPAQGKHGKAGEPLNLVPGYYLVTAVLGDGRFHEVFRYVPERLGELSNAYPHRSFEAIADTVFLPRITLHGASPADGMSRVPGTESFVMGSADNLSYPIHRRRIPSFYLDGKEVTVEEFKRVRQNFRFPNDAPVPPDNFPVTRISWDDAAAYAENIGKRLPDEAEFEYAATDLGKRKISLRQEPAGWSFEPAGQPKTDCVIINSQPPIYGLCSNVAEWTASWVSLYPGQSAPGRSPADPMLRIVRGGSWSVILGTPDERACQWQPYERLAIAAPRFYPGLGFRCARSAKPRIRPDDFIRLR